MADQVKDPYKQIWESRNLNNLGATKVELDNKTPEWERGIGAFVDEMQGTGYGLAALGAQGLQNIVGPSDTLKGVTDWGLEGYNRNMVESQSGLQAPSVARIEDIKNTSDAMDWASYQLGKGLPMLGSLALSGGIGGALGRLGVKEGVGALAKSAVGDMVKKSVVAKGLQAAEGQVVTKAMQEAAAQMVRGSISRGAMAGGFAGSFGLEGGQAFGEQVQGGAAPADAVKSAIAVGGINGALEFLPFYKVAKDIGLGEHAKRGIADIIINDSGLSKKALQLAKEVGGRVGKGAAEGIVAEGITEGLQELVSMAGERWAKNDPLFADLTKDDWSRISNAAAAGALVGGVAGGAGATVVGPQGQEQGQAAPGEITSATAPEIPVAPGIQTPAQTRAQVLAANLEQTNAAIQKAVENGDTARVEELAKAKQIYEEELTKQQEVPVQPVVEQPPEQVQEQPLVEQPPVEQASVEQPSVESPPQETPPQSEAQPTSPNDTIQLKQGETVVLSPDGQTRVVPTAEQTANLNRLMGERPSKETPLTQPTEVQDGQAQAQTEALLGQTQPAEQWDKADLATRAQWIKDTGASTDFATRKAAEWTTWDKVPPNTFQQRLPKVINPQEGGDTKYSMPLVQPVDMATDATMEEFEAVRSQFQEKQKQETPFKKWFGQGTPGVTADDSGNPVTLYHGTNNPEFNQWDSSRAGENSNHPTSGLGFFMTADQGSAARYGSNLMAVHAKIDNPYTLTDADLTSIETKDDAAKLRKKLMDQGYDGAVVTAPGGKPYVIAFESKQVKFVGNKNPTDSPDFRYSTPQAEDTTTTIRDIPETLRANVDSTMGNGWLQQAESTGLVQVINGAGPRGESGSYDGKVLRLYTKTMPKNGSPIGVLLHEGGHAAAFKDVLGNSINGYLADIDTIARNGNKTAQTTITHATIATANVLKIPHNLTENSSVEDLKNIQALIEQKAPGLFAEEKMSYFIQYASEAKSSPGFLRRLINRIKAWFAQTEFGKRLKEAGLGFGINEQMAVEWAKASLQKSLADAKEMVKAQNKVINEASKMPASERVGRALEAEAAADPYYSMGLDELRQTLWTDPTDYRQDFVNKPGLLQKFRANFIDYFADMEKKAKNVYDAYSLLRNKKSALIEQSRQEYLLPLRDLIANSPWSAKEVGDMLAARHIKMDRVNLNLAERASDEFVDDLLKVLTPAKKKELEQARKFVKDGKNPDGTAYTGAGFDPAGKPIEMSSPTKRKLVFDLMNKYSPFEVKNQNGEQDVRTKWERFKDGAAGYSDGGITKGELRSVDNVLSLTSMDQAKFDRIANLFDAMNRRTLDILEEGKLITAPEHARLLIDKSAYAPLRRESYNTNSEIEQLFLRAGQGGSKQLGTRTGTAELSEPVMVLQNALAKLEAAAAAAERNQANQELYKTIKADTETWKPWFTIVDKDKYVTHDENGFLQERNATALNKADITLILNGKKLVIRPNMHNHRAIGFVRAVNNLDVQELSGPMKVLGWFNQITRWVNVSASPVFLMKNAIMDPFTAAYNIQASEAAPYAAKIFGNYGNAFRALKKVFMDGNRDQTDPDVRAVERFENAGGRTSFVEGLRAMDDSWGSFDAQVARRQGNLKQLMAAKDKWIDGIENFNILFENVMRFSTFQVLMEKGTVTESRAARIAQDLTTNFSRRGYKTQALGVWWLFFNATVQGNYQVVRNLMSSKRVQAMAGGTIALALTLDLLGRALAPDDWDKIPEVDKERNIIVPIKVGGDFIKIPAPWVYNVLWRMGGLLGETLAGVKKPQDGLLDLAAMTATTFNPVSGGTLAQTISPTAADPFVQILENKNFAGNPLGPEGFPGAGKKANSEMIWSNTPKGYQSLAGFVNEATGGSAAESGAIDLRPADYQVLAQFLTGSLGKFLSDTVFGTKDLFTKEIEGPKDVPIIKQFFSDPYDPIRVQKYHTNVAGVFGAHKLQQMYSKGPDRDLVKLHEVMTTRGKELAMYAQVQDVERQIKSLRTRLRVAENREDTARVKELKVKIEKVQEKFNEAYKKRVG